MRASTGDIVRVAGIELESGRFYTDLDNAAARFVVVIGKDVQDALFANLNPVGKYVRISGQRFEVIGVLAKQGKFLGLESFDNQVQLPLNTFERLYGSSGYAMQVRAKDGAEHPQGRGRTDRHRPHRAGPRRAGGRQLLGDAHRRAARPRGRHQGHHLRRRPLPDGPRARGGRHRGDEHHVRVGEGAHARDRHPQGPRRAPPGDPAAVLAGSRRGVPDRRGDRHRAVGRRHRAHQHRASPPCSRRASWCSPSSSACSWASPSGCSRRGARAAPTPSRRSATSEAARGGGGRWAVGCCPF